MADKNRTGCVTKVVAVLILVGACSTIGKRCTRKDAPKVTARAPAVSQQRSFSEAVVKADQMTLGRTLADIRETPGNDVDRSGEKFDIWTVRVPGAEVATFARSKRSASAWSFHLNGVDCSAVQSLGRSVRVLGIRGLATWYSVDGGPLHGAFVKVFRSPCIIVVASEDYWRMRDETLP